MPLFRLVSDSTKLPENFTKLFPSAKARLFQYEHKGSYLGLGSRKKQKECRQKQFRTNQDFRKPNIEDLKEKVLQTTLRFNQNRILTDKAQKAFQMALSSYQIYKSRFILGKEDVSSVTLSLNRQQEAQRNYQQALSDYWTYYYTIRTLTLYDFEKEENLSYTLPIY